ncbi:hypothetical protein HPB48_004446 [Haemaphysalis longicornis]|uniref:Uncharacterized protein n=1 Tax=Haemaphysalis longicornis TaxID=44386 RepID=A0A9J6FNI5_HAELO|nr:hypothetical protein HPB48_004446 [Haemaphysalis longicornis]
MGRLELVGGSYQDTWELGVYGDVVVFLEEVHEGVQFLVLDGGPDFPKGAGFGGNPRPAVDIVADGEAAFEAGTEHAQWRRARAGECLSVAAVDCGSLLCPDFCAVFSS